MDTLNPVVRAWKREATEDPERSWGRAAEQLPWFRKWDRVFEWDPPTFRWFVGAETNLSYNCLDHHVNRGWGSHVALISENERGERRSYTYAQLLDEVKRVAAALRGMGLGKGDRVAIYMPTCPEAIILMLAVVRIGAIHLVVFAGFGSGALGDRIRLCGAKALFTTDITYRKGKDVALREIASNAVQGADSIEKVVVLSRSGAPVAMQPGRDLSWQEFVALGAGQDAAHVAVESNEPAFILATSGTTAKHLLLHH